MFNFKYVIHAKEDKLKEIVCKYNLEEITSKNEFRYFQTQDFKCPSSEFGVFDPFVVVIKYNTINCELETDIDLSFEYKGA